ncbi:unnamed protein product [Arabidopsis thaliana]|uniref:Uncharacterized protein n=1 Tax=Arabidopsis thaliana TaxID=3702 RepID=A0A654GB32_ARATH|nr:unnamed protein product [Arabidopsis thaliana]VYS70045.1 unnamed protein product [Arabidopsis thaliana]
MIEIISQWPFKDHSICCSKSRKKKKIEGRNLELFYFKYSMGWGLLPRFVKYSLATT